MAAKKKNGVKVDLRSVALAGVGAAAIAMDGAEDLYRRFVTRGKREEPGIRKTIGKLNNRRRSVQKSAGSMAKSMDGRLKEFGRNLPFVTKNDLSDLVKRIESLSEKVDALSKPKKSRRKKSR